MILRLDGAPSRTGLVFAAALLSLALAAPARAGPPFLTDDPEPTDTGHWEIYAPAIDAAGKDRNFDGNAGAEINFGAAPNLQLTLGLPISFTHGEEGYRSARGDVELSVKYRFFHDDGAGVSIAAFPGITLPTGRRGFGNRKVTALLPVWAQKDFGSWSLFGGGGYAINPGPGNRDYWTGGVGLSRQVSDRLLLGAEIDRQGGDTDQVRPATSFGLGAIMKLRAPFRLLGSAGPVYVDGERSPGYHAYVALGVDF